MPPVTRTLVQRKIEAMTSEEPSAQSTPMPKDPRAHPEQTVDALEDKIASETPEEERHEHEVDQPARDTDTDPAAETDEQTT